MITLLWDASALVKRYAAESGSATVNALYALVPTAQMVTTILGYAETWAALVRKRNRGTITASAFTTATSALQSEVIYASGFDVLSLEFDAVLAGIQLISQYSINSSDAAILTSYLRYAQAVTMTGSACVLVAADMGLIKAANAEGLQTLNPEHLSATDIPAFLAALP